VKQTHGSENIFFYKQIFMGACMGDTTQSIAILAIMSAVVVKIVCRNHFATFGIPQPKKDEY
jgi:hypothetical protein